MQFGQSNQRRRRVVADDLSATVGAASQAAVPPLSRTHRRIDGYAPGAKPVQQRRVIDLLPCTYLSAGFWLAAGLTTILGLAAGHVWLPDIAARTSAQAAAPLDLGALGSLAAWVASLWLALAGAISLLIYSIRRHKLDDYRGRYRWWLLAAGAWMVMSIDAVCGIHQLFAATMAHLTGYTGPAGGAMWWLGCWGILLGGLSARLAWEMRVCRPAMWVYLSALGLWTIGVLIETSGVRLGTLGAVLPAEVANLLGDLLILFGLGVYARHVILHAQGLLPTKKRRNKEKPGRDSKSSPAGIAQTSANGNRADLQPHAAFQPADDEEADDGEPEEEPSPPARADFRSAARPSNSAPSPAAAPLASRTSGSAPPRNHGTESDEADESDGHNRKLSKAERKRLRKLKAQEEQGW